MNCMREKHHQKGWGNLSPLICFTHSTFLLIYFAPNTSEAIKGVAFKWFPACSRYGSHSKKSHKKNKNLQLSLFFARNLCSRFGVCEIWQNAAENVAFFTVFLKRAVFELSIMILICLFFDTTEMAWQFVVNSWYQLTNIVLYQYYRVRGKI